MSPIRFAVTAATLLATLPAAPAAAQVLGFPVTSPAPRDLALAAADLDGDGHVDLAVADAAADTVAVHLGDGLEHFTLARQLAVGDRPVAVAIDDLNGDGRLDLVTANFDASTISVLLGTGPGTFGPATDYATGSNPNGIAIGDFYGTDGARDIATSNQAGSFTVRVGDGSGRFPFPIASLFIGVAAPHGIAAGDWNADGRPDFAMTSSTTGAVAIYRTSGQGFARTIVDIGGRPSRIAAGDLNRDGNLDLVVSSREAQGSVTVLLGSLGGVFTPRPPVSVSSNPVGLAVADFNADGKPDVAVACGRPTVLLGDGAGGLGSPQTATTFPSSGTTELAVADVDHDGRPDFVTNSPGVDLLYVYPGVGAAFTTTTHEVGAVPAAVACGDIDRDGAQDVVTANRSGNSVSVLPNDGAGGFGPARSFPAGVRPHAIALGDLNGVGRLDADTANPTTPGSVQVLLNDGAGGFLPAVGRSAGNETFAIAIADVNRDGRPDVVALAKSFFSILVVMLGDGAGGLGPMTSYSAGVQATSFAVGDFDRDGDQDVLIAEFGGAGLLLHVNDGAGRFSPRPMSLPASLGGFPTSLVAGDVDRNGTLDAIITGSNGVIAVMLGDGAGGFLTASTIALPSAARAPALADLNGDRHLDLAVALSGSDRISVLLGDGTGRFTQGATFPTVVQAVPSWIAVADVDRNGSLDLVCGNANSIARHVAVLRGAGSLPFGTGTSGCSGIVGMSGATAARSGSAGFGFVVTNAPRQGNGAVLIALTPDLVGTTFPTFGLEFHIDLAGPVASVPVRSDASGVGFASMPTSPNPAFIGMRLFAQSLWIENPLTGPACSSAFSHIVTSRGLAVTVLP